MNDTTIDLQQLVQEGQAAATAGDMMTARERFRRVMDLEPSNVEALIGMSAAVPVLAEKQQYLQQALAADPSNADARDGLRYVQKLIADGYQIAPSKRREVQVASGNASPLLASPSADAPLTEVLHCYRHADRETGLRCTNCNRPICAECARPAAVGQLCPECRKERRPNNYKVSFREIIIGFAVASFAAAVVALLLSIFNFGFFAFILLIVVGPAIAEFIVRIVDRVTRSKRGTAMQITIGSAIVAGTLPVLGGAVLLGFGNPLFLFIYMILAISVATARLR